MKYFTFILILFLNPTYSQQTESKNKFFNLYTGKPWFPDKDYNLHNFSIGMGFQNRFSESFAYEGYYTFSQSNNYPNFFDNKTTLNGYLLSQKDYDIVFNSLWSDVYVHNLGLKIHYAFINNPKWFFSFNLAGGFSFSKSSKHEILNWTYNEEDGQMLAYENTVLKDKLSNFYFSPGVQVSHLIYKEYHLGLDFSFVNVPDTDKTLSAPVLPLYYNASLILGKKFN